MANQWKSITDPCPHRGPAVYKVRLVDNDGKKQTPRTICRFLVQDKEGIMFIGRTGDMEIRRQQMLLAIGNRHRHSEMNHVYYINLYSTINFNAKQFQYCYSQCLSVDESKEKKEKLIKSYFKKFGEVPPLNSAIPHPHQDWEFKTPNVC